MNKREAIEFYSTKYERSRAWSKRTAYHRILRVLDGPAPLGDVQRSLEQAANSPIDPRLRAIYRLAVKELSV